MSDSYYKFYNMFLAEMPMRANGGNDFAAQLSALHENIADGYEVTPVSSTVFKLELGSVATYWVGDFDAQTVSLIVDVEVGHDFCKVALTSKNPSIAKGAPPFASDLYSIILTDAKAQNLLLRSDSIISDDALGLWKRLSALGHTLSVFDRETHQYVLQPVTNAAELDNFVGGVEHNKYVFIMSEDKKATRSLRHSVNLMEIKRRSGYPLHQLFEHFTKGIA